MQPSMNSNLNRCPGKFEEEEEEEEEEDNNVRVELHSCTLLWLGLRDFGF
jgi:hypothetical protein